MTLTEDPPLPLSEQLRLTEVQLIYVRRSLQECRWWKMHDHPKTRRLQRRERELVDELKALQQKAGGRT